MKEGAERVQLKGRKVPTHELKAEKGKGLAQREGGFQIFSSEC